ncbi:Branched-chain amino acid ABC-type transport system, permease component [Pyrobaculum oguniense TE7]|uniref:Branched-chain amino acid ABC-type transport system, permease component n=1 Tax=Pyrobaculum oguniense (strain DSM 13380 / JCM 10595 / TE7) TaxID=698757 RepID=H6Q910_PYROT|nr:Branched-chain amino acid ABC-type transport system, permease component [Pyrobaculum oguniense TE7]
MIDIIFYSIAIGTAYALMSSGFNLLLGVGRVVNLAYGAFMALTAYVYSSLSAYAPPALAAIGAIALMCAIGTFGWSLLRVLRKDEMLMIVVTLAVALFIEGGLLYAYGPYQRVVPPLVSGAVWIIPLQWIAAVATGVAVITLYHIIVSHTRIGKAMIATAENPELALMLGIQVDRILYFTSFLSSLFATTAAIMISPMLTVTPHIAWLFLTAVLAVSILGGIGNVIGSIAAGYILSFAETFSAYYVDPHVKAFIPVMLVILILVFRPRGLFGKQEERWA